MSDYIRELVRQASKKPIAVPPRPFRPENDDIHTRLEALWNSLDKRDRDNLDRMLDVFAPKLKRNRAS